MNVEERILLDRIDSLSKLGEAERRIVENDEQLLALIADNALLAGMAAVDAAEPDRQRMFQAIEAELSQSRERQAGFFSLLGGRSWQVQLGICTALALGLIGIALIMPGSDLRPGASPAWASSDGYTIVYDMPAQSGFSTSESGLSGAIEDWRAELGDSPEQMAIRVSSNAMRTRVVLSASRVNEEQVGRLVDIIAERTEMRDPQVTGTTLFENSPKPQDIMFGEPASHYRFIDEASLERIAGLLAGEEHPSLRGTLVHGGGGQILLGRYSDDHTFTQSVAGVLHPSEIQCVANEEISVVGAVSLFGGRAYGLRSAAEGDVSRTVTSGKSFSVYSGSDSAFGSLTSTDGEGGFANGFWYSDGRGEGYSVTGSLNDFAESDPEFFWRRVCGMAGGEEGNALFAEGPANTHVQTAPAAEGHALAWVSSGSGEPSAWVAGCADGNVSWTPAASAEISSTGFFSFAPAPSRFVVLGEPDSPLAAPEPSSHAGPSGYTVWTPMTESPGISSFQVLSQSRGNRTLLPGYTIFGNEGDMRMFSFPEGSTNAEIQQRLDEWYERNGQRISLKVDVEEPLLEELLLIVAEGVDSDQALIIIGEDRQAAAVSGQTEPEVAADPAPKSDEKRKSKPAPSPRDN